MKRFSPAAFGLLVGVYAFGALAQPAPSGPSQAELDLSAAATDSWLMTNKSYDGWRHVRLNQITPANVATLKPACVYDSGLVAQAQSTPLLYKGRIYFTAAQTTVAIDARTCAELWRSEWKLKGKALSTVNRGVAIKDGRLIRGTADGYLIALSMDDGKLLWERQITSFEESHYLSMPPMIVDDMIIYGTAGADWGGQGWIGAFSLKDGAEIWRYGVLPAPDAPGAKSWGSAQAVAHGGGSFWTPVSVDRQKGVLFVPIGNPAPDFFGESRPGDNEGTNTAAAIDLKTGKLLWARQFVPHDTHDWDLSQTSPLVSASIDGKARHLVIVSGKDGRLRGVDRESSEILYDLVISKQENADKPAAATPIHICPGLLGGQEWSSSAYDPDRGLVFSPMVDWCGSVSHEASAPAHQVGVHFYGGGIVQDPIGEARGVLAAVDVASGALRWKFEAPAPMLANVTTTEAGLVFAGDLKGNLFALDQDTGKALLRYSLPASAGGGLFTYALDGKQFVAALSGSVSAFFGGGKETTKLTLFALP
ncbi:alcohol dehydrogenase (cytochrome c) [Rhodoblastus acidophilus]|uniref:pyrroloquinoline quinone-dependent dehydrogenase n=1 Tax=Rhodoblastus acidophilus TaxID=1074 RepID=UPI002224D710|nr:PQQ-binding-like beta-propeller repeat protein [Rhodoblastus acidophilus]MCW2283491.1 alcohol dehydrogenase (cytochrome c) [Rhodoblastus acidophilus]MCW2332185.1 alcohol dehydrogenase (cytochrome c) [Rhodoblastus acidophilus]